MMGLEEKVKRGAALLDKVDPHWAEKVHLETLDMGDCALCVLGNLYGDYMAGLKKLADHVNVTFVSGIDYGFSVRRFDCGEFANLEKLWCAEIASRREKP